MPKEFPFLSASPINWVTIDSCRSELLGSSPRLDPSSAAIFAARIWHGYLHGGSNAYRYNTPGHPLTPEQIASRGAEFYAQHPERRIFNRVWFFDSLNSADDLNALLGLPSGYGDVKWLAQLWPVLAVDPRSSGR